MSSLTVLMSKVQGATIERLPAMRPAYPPLAIEIDAHDLVMVRLRKRGRGRWELLGHQRRDVPEECRGKSMLRPGPGAVEDMTGKVGDLYSALGAKPGKVSLVLPDNVAKVSVLHLPDRPGSRRQLDEIVRFKLRRAVPFRLEDAVVSYQPLATEGRGMDLLVAVVRQFVVEQYEALVAASGGRPGLVDLCTPNVLNLARGRLDELAADGGDAALLNCAPGYFTLVIVRSGRPIFFRCKSIASDEDGSIAMPAFLREMANSFAYYKEKLGGARLGGMIVRSTPVAPDEVIDRLPDDIEAGVIEPLEPSAAIGLGEGVRLEPAVAQRIAPAVGAAIGRVGR